MDELIDTELLLRAEDAIVSGVIERVTSEFRGFWDATDITDEIPGIIRDEFRKAFAEHLEWPDDIC